MKYPFFTLILLAVACGSIAQPRKITGSITDAATQQPIKNVNIVLKGSPNGAITNYLGAFELTIEDPATYNVLVASHIGFGTATFLIPKEDRFRFSLKKEYLQLHTIELGGPPFTDLPPEIKVTPPNVPKDYVVVESAAEYPIGIAHFVVHAGNILKRDLRRIKNDFEISFTIDTTGAATDITVSDTNKETVEAVNNIFKETLPWVPATQRGKKVTQHFRARVTNGINYEVVKNLMVYLYRNVRYPDEAKRSRIEGPVNVTFSIDKKGKVSDISFALSIGAGANEEIKRVLESIPPAIAQQLVQEIHTKQFALPVGFGLDKPYDRTFFRSPSMVGNICILPHLAITAAGN
ncbi:MAG TPA: TonB family protein [Cyclobacteriaceae bacterium]|nr:TonB family protein [Cyclobacteriaceae bacterium]